jgi:ribonuclease PH
MTGGLSLIEVQGSAEGAAFTRDQLITMMDLAERGVAQLVAAQKDAVA